jgi:O-acetylserine/cysteine efflux transporter
VPATHFALLIGIQLLWGANFVVAKVGIGEIPPLMFVALRFALIWLLVIPFMRWHRGSMGSVLAIALTAGAAHFGMMMLGLDRADDVAPVAIAVQLGVPFATVLSVFFLGERLGIWRFSALVVAFSGVLVLGFDPAVFGYADALVLVVTAAFMWSVSAIFMRRIRGVPVYDLQGWVALATWPVLLVWSLATEPHAISALGEATWVGWGAVVYSVFAVSLIGHAGFYWFLQRHEVTSAAPVLLLAPIIGAVGGVLVLGDSLTWRMVLGGAMTLAGVLIITVREGRRQHG